MQTSAKAQHAISSLCMAQYEVYSLLWLKTKTGWICCVQDVNKDPGAEDTFKAIGEAYEVRVRSKQH
jgi:hypothetical protein